MNSTIDINRQHEKSEKNKDVEKQTKLFEDFPIFGLAWNITDATLIPFILLNILVDISVDKLFLPERITDNVSRTTILAWK